MFNKYPLINYNLTNDGVTKNPYLITDILTRTRMYLSRKEKENYFIPYTVKAFERPEDISYSQYGTEYLHWTILYVNEIYDIFEDWYKNDDDLLDYCKKKYGENYLDQVHSFTDDYNNPIGTPFIQNCNYSYFAPQKLQINLYNNNFDVGTQIYFHMIPTNEIEKNIPPQVLNVTQILSEDAFVVDYYPVDFSWFNISNVNATIAEVKATSLWGSNIESNETEYYGGSRPPYDGGLQIITNYAYEIARNEIKKYIRIIHPKYMSSFITKVEEKINYVIS